MLTGCGYTCQQLSEVYLLVGGVVGLELLVVGELDVDRLLPDDGHHCGVITHHVLSRFLRVHLQEGLTGHTGQCTSVKMPRQQCKSSLQVRVLHLVLGFEQQQVGDVSEGQTEADHVSLCDVAGKLADVKDPGRHPGTSYVTFELLIVVAIGYEVRKQQQHVRMMCSCSAGELDTGQEFYLFSCVINIYSKIISDLCCS